MKTKAVRLYGVGDLRLEEFELLKIKDDEILAHIFRTVSACPPTRRLVRARRISAFLTMWRKIPS